MLDVVATVLAYACLAVFAGRAVGVLPQRVAGRAVLGLVVAGVMGATWVFGLLPVLFVGWVLLGPTRKDRKRALRAARQAQIEETWHMVDDRSGPGCCDSNAPLPHRHRPYEAATPSTPRRRRPYDPPVAETPVARAERGLLEYAGDVRLPEASRERIGALHDRLAEATTYVSERGLSQGLQGFGLEQIRDDFAPNAILSYLALPPSTARTTVLVEGKTGADLLNDQLDLMIKGVDQHLVAAAMASGDQLLAGERFLQEKFGDRPPGLDL